MVLYRNGENGHHNGHVGIEFQTAEAGRSALCAEVARAAWTNDRKGRQGGAVTGFFYSGVVH